MVLDPLLTLFWLKALSRRSWELLLEDVETWPADYAPAALA
jgi:hypothetical protein